ncbi:MAG TPA: uroporphyrinogen decarboxylase family protein [Phycisphaerae bacterium]|nr:uroporphyrinogen decarboxylase family protein [Phycisphaerae bacterium]
MVSELKNDLVLRAARRERTERTPVWLMRQAGRFDPEYQRVRDRVRAPLEMLFRTPDVAAEISLLPKRLGVDAIIFFQDILTPLAPMGAEFLFRPGPILPRPVRTAADIGALQIFDPAEKLDFVGDTLRMVRDDLNGEVPLLGFAGAPLTLAFFLAAGESPFSDPQAPLSMLHSDRAAAHRLLARLADMTADYLAYQIESGADAVQLFESGADLLSEAEYREFAHPYQVRVLEQLAARVPTILFVKEQPFLELMVETGADVLSVGGCVDLADAQRRYGGQVAFQGNVSNELLARGTAEEIETAVRACVAAGGHQGHILNLNHGVLRDTPFENVQRMIETCKTTVLSEAIHDGHPD